MKKSTYALLTVIAISSSILTSCNKISEEEKEFDKTMQEVIYAHDEVMPQMTEISTLINDLESKMDTTATGQKYAKAQQDLKNAHDFMMEWMQDFSEKFPHQGTKLRDNTPDDLQKQLSLLKEEEKEVKQMRDAVNNSIKQAKELLGKSE